jgi:hypothetical protein
MTEVLHLVSPSQLTSGRIVEALRKWHGSPDKSWAFFDNLRTGTGYDKDCQQMLDAWAIGLWGSWTRVTYEIKISRGDFFKEMKSPLKRRLGLLYSNEFYFVTPKGLLKPGEIPVECGLQEVDEEGGIRVVVPAPHRDTPAPTWRFMASVARRIAKEEQGIR